MSNFKASCTWGDGPDVLLVNDGKGYLIYEEPETITHQERQSFYGSACLSAKEAEDLAYSLLAAAAYAREMDRSVEEYFKHEQIKLKHKELDEMCKI